MAFFIQILLFWVLLWVLSKVYWQQKLASNTLKGRISFAIAYSIVGVVHLVSPEKLSYMIPEFIPYPETMVYLSGVLEIGFSVLLLIPGYQKVAGWLIIGLLLAVFPANVHVAINNLPAPGGLPAEPWYLWSRLAFQPIYISWVWWAAIYVDKNRYRASPKTSGVK